MLRFKKLLIFFCFFITVLIIVGLSMCCRENFGPHKFDVVTFFSDNGIPLDSDKILYSDILSLEKTPVVLASFLLSEEAWKKFISFMQPYKSKDTTPSFSPDKDIFPHGIPAYSYHLNGHLIYIYDIRPLDDGKNVAIKCLIDLSL